MGIVLAAAVLSRSARITYIPNRQPQFAVSGDTIALVYGSGSRSCSPNLRMAAGR